ncbi:hypothetical protein L218DRAFT_157870 [Marasmius fiardii PR-910]|nr:hypothetical protein L218DRAFT_157870 [Marasmius fiardii PR-910]
MSSLSPPLPPTSSHPSPHVHFPPTPVIVSSSYVAHSSLIYDRAPIEVGPNSCALPERGGRVIMHAGSPPISIKGGHDWARERIGSYFHPLAYEACEPEEDTNDVPVPSPSAVPQLIRDSSSSESDESTEGPYGSPRLSPIPVFNLIPPSAMSFLPHAGSRPLTKKKSETRPKLNRRKTPSSAHGCYTRKTLSIEDPQSLDDGCLGGF